MSGEATPYKPHTPARRGWRFFTWDGVLYSGEHYSPEGEKRVEPDHPYAKLVTNLEMQVAERLLTAGVQPLEDLDVCFYLMKFNDGMPEGAYRAGAVMINADDRIQMIIWINADLLKNEPHRFAQTLLHEYCHALVIRAGLTVDGAVDFSEETQKRLNRETQAGLIVEEALADAFVMLHDRRLDMYPTEFLSFDELWKTNEYRDAYSLTRVLAGLTSDLDNRGDNFLYETLRLRGDQKGTLLECLTTALESDLTVNSQRLSFAELYEQTYSRQVAGEALSPVTVKN